MRVLGLTDAAFDALLEAHGIGYHLSDVEHDLATPGLRETPRAGREGTGQSCRQPRRLCEPPSE
jgi:hypothetical protein